MPYKTLKNLGWEDKEIKVYLALLELGGAKVSQIAEKSQVHRVTVYDVLDYLEQKNAVTKLIKNKEKYFQAISPREILEQEKLKISHFENILPEFDKLTNQAPYENVQYFQGEKSLQFLINDILTAQKEILCILNPQGLIEDHFQKAIDFTRKRVDKKIHMKIIILDSSFYQKINELPYPEYREVKCIPNIKQEFQSSIYIYNNKSAHIDFSENPTGLIIENAHMKNTFSTIFKLLWNSN